MLNDETFLLTYPALIGLSPGRSISNFLVSLFFEGLGNTLTTGIWDTLRSALTAFPIWFPTFSSWSTLAFYMRS
jgi:hypothetical protein